VYRGPQQLGLGEDGMERFHYGIHPLAHESMKGLGLWDASRRPDGVQNPFVGFPNPDLSYIGNPISTQHQGVYSQAMLNKALRERESGVVDEENWAQHLGSLLEAGHVSEDGKGNTLSDFAVKPAHYGGGGVQADPRIWDVLQQENERDAAIAKAARIRASAEDPMQQPDTSGGPYLEMQLQRMELLEKREQQLQHLAERSVPSSYFPYSKSMG